MADPKTVEITAEERSQIWDITEMAYSGALEGLSSEAHRGVIDYDTVVEVRQWLGAIEVLGRERDVEQGCAVPCNLPFSFVLEAAEKQALNVLGDNSKTLARTVEKMKACDIADQFLPPAEGDTEGGYLIALCHVKAVTERVEEAEPKLARTVSAEVTA